MHMPNALSLNFWNSNHRKAINKSTHVIMLKDIPMMGSHCFHIQEQKQYEARLLHQLSLRDILDPTLWEEEWEERGRGVAEYGKDIINKDKMQQQMHYLVLLARSPR